MKKSPIEKKKKPQGHDVAIIGGGLAGGVAAIVLARKGFDVVLFEKEPGPHHKVCGEFLSGESAPILRKLGVDIDSLGAVEISRFRLHGPKRSCEFRLPVKALGISRKALDEKVLECAEKAGAKIRRGVAVKEILEGLESPCGSIVLSTGETEVRAQRLIVATGKAEFKSLHERVGRDSGYVGFKMHLKLKPSAAARIKDHCDLFVFEHGYGGLSMVEGGLANFCFLIEKSALKGIGSSWEALASHIARHSWAASRYLDGAEPQFRHMVTVSGIPYGFLRRTPPPPGVFFVGDQMAVIPSLTGDGMSIALMTGQLAAERIMEKVSGKDRLAFAADSARAYQRFVRSKLRSQIETGYLVHRIFKQPRLIDYAAKALRRFPFIVERIFLATRCDLVLNAAQTKPKKRLAGTEATILRH